MKLLLVGNGGREHAIADTLARETPSLELLAAPGNPGLAELARCLPVKAGDVDQLVHVAETEGVEAVIIGPEAPLAAGLADRLALRGVPVFGPTQEAARIETSKAFAKALMLKAGVPTARAETHADPAHAKAAVRERFGAPVVIKASGLAAGKGVIVCETVAAAEAAIDRIMADRAFGEAGAEVLVEAFMKGEELSVFAVTDGTDVLTLRAAQDHKRLREGDEGPNTGGMGAYAPVSLGTDALVDDVTERILLPTLHALDRRGTPFRGVLYAGLMLTADGPQVVEFNCRLGDPEAQVVLPLLESSLLEPVLAVARGARIGSLPSFRFRDAAAVTTVVASPGYPDAPRTGAPLTLPEPADDLRIFHAGTSRDDDGTLRASGGRVVALTGIAPTFEAARTRSREAAEAVELEDAQLRRDIGWREAARLAAAG